MLKYAKLINDSGLVYAALGTDETFYKEQGFTIQDIEKSEVDNQWYLTKKCPHKSEREKEKEERERLDALTLTKADFWIALLDADITKNMVIEKVQTIKDDKLKAKTLIRIEDAQQFYRGDLAMNTVGKMLGFSSNDLDYLFEHKVLPQKENNK